MESQMPLRSHTIYASYPVVIALSREKSEIEFKTYYYRSLIVEFKSCSSLSLTNNYINDIGRIWNKIC
jgi:hypothetical protein